MFVKTQGNFPPYIRPPGNIPHAPDEKHPSPPNPTLFSIGSVSSSIPYGKSGSNLSSVNEEQLPVPE